MPMLSADMSRVVQGEMHIDTSLMEKNLPYGPLLRVIHKALAKSGYVNVEVIIKKAPQYDHTEDDQGRPTFTIKKNDKSGLKGPVIEIRTLDGLFAGEYALELTKTGIKGSIPPPVRLLKQVRQNRKGLNPGQAPAIGLAQAPQGIQEAPRGYGQARQGFRETPQILGQAPRVFRQGPPDFPQGPPDFPQGPQGSRQAARGLEEAPYGRRQVPLGLGQSSSSRLRQAPQTFGGNQQQYGQPRTNSDRFYSSAPVAAVPPRPVPAKRIPTSTGPRRAPVPINAFSQNGYSQFQGGFNSSQRQPQDFNKEQRGKSSSGCCSGGDSSPGPTSGYDRPGQPQGFNKNKREKSSSGCCSGGDVSPGPTSTYDRLDGSEKERKQSQKEREKRAKKERKRAEEIMKKQSKNRKGGYGGSNGMYAEKSGFYDDNKRENNWCCC